MGYLITHLPVGSHHKCAEVSDAIVRDLYLHWLWLHESVETCSGFDNVVVKNLVRGTGYCTCIQSATTREIPCIEDVKSFISGQKALR